MLTEALADFLRGPQMCYLGTASSDGAPCVYRVVGLRVDVGGDTISMFISDLFKGQLNEQLQGNRQLSLTASSGADFETYQFKGTLLGEIRPGDAAVAVEQRALLDSWRTAYAFMGEAMSVFFDLHPTSPCQVLTMQVQEMFGQTPRAGAGGAVTERD